MKLYLPSAITAFWDLWISSEKRKKTYKNAHVLILRVLMLWINIVRFEKFSNKFNHNTVKGLNPGVISKVGWV